MSLNFDVGPYEVISNGVTVWVNREGCLARFGVHGIDIHCSPTEQRRAGSQCLFCTHTETTRDDWELFKTKVLELYGISVDDTHCPTRLKEDDNAHPQDR